MSKVALIGASGQAGSRILKELSSRGHTVTAIARNPEKIASLPGVTPKKGDVFDKSGLAELLKGHDAVISSVHFTASDPKLLVEAVRASGVKRYLVVGRRGQPGDRSGQAPRRPAGLPPCLQGGGGERGGIPRPTQGRNGTRLDIPLSFRRVRSRGAHR